MPIDEQINSVKAMIGKVGNNHFLQRARDGGSLVKIYYPKIPQELITEQLQLSK